MNDSRDINYAKEALLHPWNLAFLIVAMLTAFIFSGQETLLNLVLIMTAAAELIYLGIVPRNERFQRAVRSRQAAEHAKPPSQKEVFTQLTKFSQRRYIRLRKIEKDIQANYAKLSYASQGILNSHLQKIDGLLDSYLNLLYQKERFEHSVQSGGENEIIQSIASLRRSMEDDPPKVQALKQRRLKILEQRLGRFKKSRENILIIEAQIDTIEDVTKYIHEQSLTLRNPEEISYQLDTLLSDVEEARASIEQIEDVFSNTGDLLGLDALEEEEDTSDETRGRTRLRE